MKPRASFRSEPRRHATRVASRTRAGGMRNSPKSGDPKGRREPAAGSDRVIENPVTCLKAPSAPLLEYSGPRRVRTPPNGGFAERRAPGRRASASLEASERDELEDGDEPRDAREPEREERAEPADDLRAAAAASERPGGEQGRRRAHREGGAGQREPGAPRRRDVRVMVVVVALPLGADARGDDDERDGESPQRKPDEAGETQGESVSPTRSVRGDRRPPPAPDARRYRPPRARRRHGPPEPRSRSG
jgi:hypothetical protein